MRCHVADLIQEQGPASGLFEFANPPLICAGERASFMSEKLTFQERLGNRGTINGEKWGLGAPTVLIKGSGNKFFAGATFADDEYIHILWRNSANSLADSLHGHSAADESIGVVLGAISLIEQRRHIRHPADHQCLLNYPLQLLRIERFREIVVRT